MIMVFGLWPPTSVVAARLLVAVGAGAKAAVAFEKLAELGHARLRLTRLSRPHKQRLECAAHTAI